MDKMRFNFIVTVTSKKEPGNSEKLFF